jgi:hypothetical protein
MRLIWTKHAIVRGHSRMGRYGMQKIENNIIKNINRATPNLVGDSAMVPFKLGRTKYVAVLAPESADGLTVVVKSVYEIDNHKHRAIFGKKKS